MSPQTAEELRAGLDASVQLIDRDFEKQHRSFSRVLGALGFVKIPYQEIRHIWLVDYSILKLTLIALPSGTGKEDLERIRALTMVADYLYRACRSPNLADAWSCANLATAFLAEGVRDEDLKAASMGLMASDKSLSRKASDRLREMEKMHGRASFKKKGGRQSSERGALFGELILRSFVWDGINRRTSLRIRLLLLVFVAMLVSLVLVVYRAAAGPVLSPYIAMTILGAFGGSVSATLTARKSVVDAVSYRLIVTLLGLRMLLGAVGAFIIYLVLQWPGIFDQALVGQIAGEHPKDYLFLSLGIASGFSERLFVGTLEKISDKLSINSEDRQMDEEKSDGSQQS